MAVYALVAAVVRSEDVRYRGVSVLDNALRTWGAGIVESMGAETLDIVAVIYRMIDGNYVRELQMWLAAMLWYSLGL
jgi:hypothetical protein